MCFRSIGTIAAKTYINNAESHRHWLLELMGQIRSFVRFSNTNTKQTEQFMSTKFDAASNTAGGFHLLFDVFCLVIIIYAEINGLIVPEGNYTHETNHDKATWSLSFPNDLSLNSRWEHRINLLPVALQSLIATNESKSANKKSGWKNFQHLSTQLAEWFLQLLHSIDYVRSSFGENRKQLACSYGLSQQHIAIMQRCLSVFKGAEQYNEASMWARLLTTYCL